MLFLPIALAQAAIPPAAFPPMPDMVAAEVTDDPIVVSALALQETAATLADCLARTCPPAEDISASIDHATNQMIAGDVQGARDTLRASRGRNKRFADRLPDQVSELLFFDAEVALLLGHAGYGRIATIDSLYALKAGARVDEPRLAMQRLRLADVFLRQGRYMTAVKMYDAVARRAAEGGWTRIEGEAMFRALRFYAMAASVNPIYSGESKRRYAALRTRTDPALQPLRDASLMLEAKLKLLSDPSAKVDDVLGDGGGTRTRTPVLLIAPAIDLSDHAFSLSGDGNDEWAQFSFRVTPDGDVTDVEMTGKAPHAQDWWIRKARTSLGGRRYMPLDVPADSDGIWQHELFLVVGDYSSGLRSRIRVRQGKPRLYTVDLTRNAGEVR